MTLQADLKVNYALRPAKSIERRMMAEALQRMAAFAPLSTYHYIGFGSFFYSDFRIIHKQLGINKMTSIEGEARKYDRCRFNRPFSCIEIQNVMAKAFLGAYDWGERVIVWLDNISGVDASILSDISFFVSNALSGSVLIVTVNAQPDALGPDKLGGLAKRVGESRIPVGTSDISLEGWGTAAVSRRIIANQIERDVVARNGAASPEVGFSQIFNFQYADSSRMLTVGGVLVDSDETARLSEARFDLLPFVRASDKPFRIEVPNLTLKEARDLDSQLPAKNMSKVRTPGVPREDVAKYARLYRYFPSFVEAEL